MTRQRWAARAGMANTAWFLWYWAAAALPVYLSYRDLGRVFLLLGMAVPFVLLGCARYFIKSLALFLLANGLTAAGTAAALLLSPAREWAVDVAGLADINVFIWACLGILAASLVLSFRVRFAAAPEYDGPYEDPPNPAPNSPEYGAGLSLFFAATLAAACAVGEYQNAPAYSYTAGACAALLLALRYGYWHMASVDNTLELAGPSETQPVRAILSFNNKLAAACLGLMLLTALTAMFSGLGGALWQWLAAFWGWLTRLIRRAPRPAEPARLEAPMDFPAGAMSDFQPAVWEENSHALSWLWALLERIGYVAIWAGIIALVIYIGRKIYKRFYAQAQPPPLGDTAEFVPPDIWAWAARRLSAHAPGPSHRVRRLFYRKARKYMRGAGPQKINILAPTDTALEMAAKIKALEDISALTEQYMDVRYGNDLTK